MCHTLQGRQKLARFNAHEFATLVIDILADAKRRQQGSSPDNVKGDEKNERTLNGVERCITLNPFVLHPDNVELILKDIGNRHGSVSPEIDQPDYDSVASDEENDQEPTSGKDERTKVRCLHVAFWPSTIVPDLIFSLRARSRRISRTAP